MTVQHEAKKRSAALHHCDGDLLANVPLPAPPSPPPSPRGPSHDTAPAVFLAPTCLQEHISSSSSPAIEKETSFLVVRLPDC